MEKKRRISLQDVLGAVLCILFIPIIILNVILIVSNYMHPGEMPEAFGVKPAVVLSGSMEPEIMTGDLIFLHRADTADLKEGDVICYLISGKAVTHRIIKVIQDSGGQERYITRGDANNVEDRQPVSPDQVQGIWKGGRIGGLGNLFIHMQTPGDAAFCSVSPYDIYYLGALAQKKGRPGRKAAQCSTERKTGGRTGSHEAAAGGTGLPGRGTGR